jgi:hypothetical protein
MLVPDIVLLFKKIIVGIVIALVPLLILYAGLQFIQHVFN